MFLGSWHGDWDIGPSGPLRAPVAKGVLVSIAARDGSEEQEVLHSSAFERAGWCPNGAGHLIQGSSILVFQDPRRGLLCPYNSAL